MHASIKKYLIFISVFAFLLFGFLITQKTFAAPKIPSFELYSKTCGVGLDCTPYPAVQNVTVYKYSNYIVVTAHIFDQSGVSSAVASIEDPNNHGKYLISSLMYDDGAHFDQAKNDGIFGTNTELALKNVMGKTSIDKETFNKLFT